MLLRLHVQNSRITNHHLDWIRIFYLSDQHNTASSTQQIRPLLAIYTEAGLRLACKHCTSCSALCPGHNTCLHASGKPKECESLGAMRACIAARD